ncbi:Signal transduction histidine kinase [Lachnospiraceae bacterium C7]|nr:Signal transduction histidine kinase [Lachnospiraceae bacterium C7]
MQVNELEKVCKSAANSYVADYFNKKIFKETAIQQNKLCDNALSAEIWILNSRGEKVASNKNDTVKSFSIKPKKLTSKKWYAGNFFNCFSKETISVYSPVKSNNETVGYVIIHKNEEYVASYVNDFMKIVMYTLVIIILISWIMLTIVKLTIYNRFTTIMKAVYSYAQGDFSKRLSSHSNDEIGYLANTLNYMATELDTLEEDERIFVSNVSHDFRSPLTSIKGYVEAIMDGTIPVEMQDTYLAIIRDETNRLTNLTQSLLDLNQFGKNGVKLNISTFDINSTISSTIQIFGAPCMKKDLHFNIKFAPESVNGALMVSADCDKIKQVLYNLIDNAIKFSTEHSTIDIETYVKRGTAFVSIKDHGIGISADCISKIWDRFYKTDMSRGRDKKGSGLGLSIVKAIINAHNENINVVSTESVGTEFIFTLPRA